MRTSSTSTGRTFSINMPSGSPPLRLGQIIPGKVMGFSDGNPIVLLGERPVIAESRVALKIGERLQLKVEGVTNGKMQLRILDSSSSSARPNVENMARSIGLNDSPASRLLLSALDGKGEFPDATLLQKAHNLLEASGNIASESNEQGVLAARTALAIAKLELTDAPGIKNILNSLTGSSTLQSLFQKIASHPALRNFMESLPDSDNKNFTSNLVNSVKSSGISMEKNIAHLLKANSDVKELPSDLKLNAAQTGTPEGKELANKLTAMQLSSVVSEAITIPLPFIHKGNPTMAELTTRGGNQKSSSPRSASLELDMPQTGKLRGIALLLDKRISVRIELENPAAIDLFRAAAPSLRKKLTNLGLEVSGVSIHPMNATEARPLPIPGSIDVRV